MNRKGSNISRGAVSRGSVWLGVAMSEVKNALNRELEKARDHLCYVDSTALTDEERRENMDAQAKLSFFQRKGLRALA